MTDKLTRIGVVVPTCRGYALPCTTYMLATTLDVRYYIVHDREAWPVSVGGEHVKHIVNPDAALYGKFSDSIRSAGFVEAYADGCEFIVSLDDDCVVDHMLEFLAQHLVHLRRDVPVTTSTVPQLKRDLRGYPGTLEPRQVAISHGLWRGVPDVTGEAQVREDYTVWTHDIKPHKIHPPFPQCAMNFAFRGELTPVMYQPAQGPHTAYERFADIWGGLFAQKVLERDYAFYNGGASVTHLRASNAKANMHKERAGARINAELWQYVWEFEFPRRASLAVRYAELANHVSKFNDGGSGYFSTLGANMLKWLTVCNERAPQCKK